MYASVSEKQTDVVMQNPSIFDSIKLPAGTILFKEGDKACDAFIIQRGEIEIVLIRPEGDQILATRRTGDILGEMALIDSHPRSATARVTSDCELLVVTAERFSVRLKETDPIVRGVLGVVLTRYRDTLQTLSGQKDVALPAPSPTEHSPIDDAVEMLRIEQELRQAIDREELEMFYQPIVNLQSGRIAGFEALIRWRHPVRGLIPPFRFIPIAEATGLISDVTDWMFSNLHRILPDMMIAGLGNVSNVDPLFLSVNVSGRDLVRPGFTDDLAHVLTKGNIPPESIKLEVTETMLIEEPEKAGAVLSACRKLGLGIALDDFGTGYSSLGQLAQFPISTLKLDQSFTRVMENNAQVKKIVNAVLRLADDLDIPVVAEGIETQTMADMLRDLRCALGQGYLFSRPIPLAETLDLIRHWDAYAAQDNPGMKTTPKTAHSATL